MSEKHQNQIDTQRIVQHEDEIELIDILRVVWKWKYFILIGTIICGIIAAIISLNIPKFYSIDMVLRPGILSIEEGGRNVFLDSPQNIKALIESEAFNDDLLDYLKNNSSENLPKKLRFKVTIPDQSDTILVQYETSNIKQGIALQNRLIELLLNSKLKYIRKTILSHERNVKKIEERISELTTEIELIKKNTANLIEERNKLISTSKKENNVLSVLLYTNTIQQNLKLTNNYQDEINKHEIIKEKELQKIENIQNIQILQPATCSSLPIKPKIGLNVILSFAAGFFFFLFLSFFLEYLKRHKGNNK